MFLVSLPHTWPVQFSSSTERLAKFRGCISKGRHLFPFRTQQLSLSAPMVLGGPPPRESRSPPVLHRRADSRARLLGASSWFWPLPQPVPPAFALLRAIRGL